MWRNMVPQSRQIDEIFFTILQNGTKFRHVSLKWPNFVITFLDDWNSLAHELFLFKMRLNESMVTIILL